MLLEFKEVNINPDISQNGVLTELVINLEGEQFDLFIKTLSKHLSIFTHDNLMRKVLLKKRKSEEEIAQILDFQREEIAYSEYFFKNTEILLKEYFKNNNQINLDSFTLFNMKGMKEEVDDIIEDIDILMSLDGDLFEFEGLDVFESSDEIFGVIKNQINEMGLEMATIDELHIYEEKGRLVVKDTHSNIIDNKYLLTEFGVVLEISLDSDTTSKDFEVLGGIFFILCIANVFEVSKIVVHKTVKEHTLNLLKENMIEYDALNNDIKIEYCEGCNDCE